MNKSILASLIATILISGCDISSSVGSSSSGSSSNSSGYSWQMVQLKSVDEDSLDSQCIIYADSELDDEKVISADIATIGYNVLYHNPDGSIADTISADEITDGLLNIALSDVPDNGFVTLEETESIRGGDSGSYMFSVQKSLLSDMVVNVAQDQKGDCYSGSDHRVATEELADGEVAEDVLVNVADTGGSDTIPIVNAYYQSSYDLDSVDGKALSAGILVDAPFPADHDVLVTAFTSYDSISEQKTGLSSWVFINEDTLYQSADDSGFYDTSALNYYSDSEDDSDVLSTVAYAQNGDITLNDDSAIIVLHNDNSFLWQSIYGTSTSFNLAYASNEVSQWNGYLSGSESTTLWDFSSFNPLTNEGSLTLPGFNVTANVDALISIIDTCTTGITYCLDTNNVFADSDFTHQRVHVRLTETNGGDTTTLYQSLYSLANIEPVILESSIFDFTAIPSLDRIEINLMDSDADSADAVQYLMAQNLDVVSVGEYNSAQSDDAETDFYSDINGFIATNNETKSLYKAILNSTTLTLKNNYEL